MATTIIYLLAAAITETHLKTVEDNMTYNEKLKKLDELEREHEKALEYIREQRRELINKHNLNKGSYNG